MHVCSTTYWRMRCSNVVESLIGPDIALRASHFISKDPFEGRATPWHQDVDYFRRSDMLSSYDGITTVWLALSESNRDNGCMRVIAGSHRQGFADHLAVDVAENTFDTGIPDIDATRGRRYRTGAWRVFRSRWLGHPWRPP